MVAAAWARPLLIVGPGTPDREIPLPVGPDETLNVQAAYVQELRKPDSETPSQSGLEGIMAELTQHELELMMMISDGFTNKEIAIATGRALPTVKNTLAKIKDKLGARNAPHAVKLIIMGGL
jgi:DNA-binding NarL/FixJ family response regulator